MPPYGNLSLGEIIDAAERRAASGDKVHPGFDFASMAPSPLKVAQQEAEEAAQAAEASAAEPAAEPSAAAPHPDEPAAGIDSDLDNAWSRLKRSINPS